MPEEYSLSPHLSPRDLCSPITGPEAGTDCEIYSGDWASLSTTEGTTKRSLAPAECGSEGSSWTGGACGDFPEHAKKCSFAAQHSAFPSAECDEKRCPWQQTCLVGTGAAQQPAFGAQAEVAAAPGVAGNEENHCPCRQPCQGPNPSPWAVLAAQAEEAQFQRGVLRNVQDRLDHIETALETWKLSKEELDAKIYNVERDCTGHAEQLTKAFYQLERRLKKLHVERKTLTLSAQEGFDAALREVKDSVKDMSVTLVQGLQDKVRAADVHDKFDDVDDLLRELQEEVKICHSAHTRLCLEEDHAKLRAQVLDLEAQLWKLHSSTAEVPAPIGGMRGSAALPGNCISWNVAEAMQETARSSPCELSFSSFNRVSSAVFLALDFRGLRLAFVRKMGASMLDLPKSWFYLHAPRRTYLEFDMTVGSEERRFAHEFETARSFGGAFNLPFTSNFDLGDLHEGMLVQTLYEGSDGRQSASPRLACVMEVNAARTINGRSRKVVYVAFPDGYEQAVEFYWITCVQKLPPLSVVITNARQNRHFGNDVSVMTFSVRES